MANCSTRRDTGRAAAEAASSAISHIAKHGNVPPPVPTPAHPNAIPINTKPKRKRTKKNRVKLCDLPMEIKTMIVGVLERDKRYFDVWSLGLVSQGWRSAVSGGGRGEEAAENAWKRRYYLAASIGASTVTYQPGCISWRETFLAHLAAICYQCGGRPVHKPAHLKWKELISWKWAKVCFPCSGDTSMCDSEGAWICSGCDQHAYAYECSYSYCWHCCWHCCRGCDRHREPRNGWGRW